MSKFAFLDTKFRFSLPATFDWNEYIEIERELWALFPETDGRRVNIVQGGLTAQIYAEVKDDGSELGPREIYMLMACDDLFMRPIRMEACRRLTLSEFRMGNLTAVKLLGRMAGAGEVLKEVGERILGDEVVAEVMALLRESNSDGN